LLTKIVANQGYWFEVTGSDIPQTITGDSGGPIDPVLGNWNVIGQPNGVIPVMDTIGTALTGTIAIEDRTSTTAFVVDPSADPGQRGTYQTIQDAINAAPKGSVIFIKNGFYNEDVVLKNGIILTSYSQQPPRLVFGAGWPGVQFWGKMTLATEAVVKLMGITFLPKNSPSIQVSGSSESKVYIENCILVSSFYPCILMTSTSTDALVSVNYSSFDKFSRFQPMFQVSGNGSLTLYNVNTIVEASVNSISTFSSSGILRVINSDIRFPINTSGTGRISATDSNFNTATEDATPLTISADASTSSINNSLKGCNFYSGTAASLMVNNGASPTTVNINAITISSQNVQPLQGNGTIIYSGIAYTYSNFAFDPALTITRSYFDGGRYVGEQSGTAVLAGTLGELIRSLIPFASAIAVVNNVAKDVTSITLSAGTWDISGIVQFTGLVTGTSQAGSIGDTSNTLNSGYGDYTTSATFTNTTVNDVGVTIPAYRVRITPADVIGGTNIRYLIALVTYTAADTVLSYGRISAVRVA
jgi:hypothetical protein